MLALLKDRSSRLPWALLFAEALAIALSVGLAFSAQEWREARREDSARTEALLNFRAELTRNRAAAEAAIPYHEDVHRRTLALLTGPGADSLRHMGEAMDAIGWNGPGGAYLPRTALLAAEATGAMGLMDFETAGAIADAYAMQDFLDATQLSFLTEAGFNPAMFDAAGLRASMWSLFMYFNASLGSERTALQVYDRALDQIAEDLGEGPANPAARN